MKNILPYLIAAVLLILYLNQCEKNITDKRSSDNVERFLTDSIQYQKNRYGKEIASRTALYSNLQVLLSKERDQTGQLRDLVKYYKKVAAAANIGQEIRIDTILIGYEIPVPITFHRSWSKTTDWYNISGQSNQDGISIDNLTIPNQLSFVIGDAKKGWLNSEYRISAVNSNPLISTTQLDGYSIRVPEKRFGVSLVVGYGFTPESLQPFAGVGLSYSLFRF